MSINPDGEARSSPLFRSEALAHAGHRTHGVVILARPTTYSLITALFMIFAVVIVAFFFCASYTRKVAVQGMLLPTQGLIKVTSLQAGLVSESRVKEGQTVHAGDVLFVLTSERVTERAGDAGATVSELLRSRRDSLLMEQAQMRQQDSQRLVAARHRAQDIDAEMRRINDQIALQQRRVELARTALKRYVDLAESNFVSPVQVQDKQAELLDQE